MSTTTRIRRLTEALTGATALSLLPIGGTMAQARPVLDLRIGSIDGDTVNQFHHIGGVHVFPTGEVAVLDNGSTEIRLFSKRGVFLRRIARSGDGPGEFRAPAWLATGRDVLAVMGQGPRA